MKANQRRAVVAIAIPLFLLAYIVAAATMGSAIVHWAWWAQALYYAAAGILWALPLKPLFVWISRSSPDKRG
jgi:hypothetical protein